MRVATVLGASMTLLATAAVAAPGDTLVVTGEVVNVRAGPGMGQPVLFHAYRDQQAEELARTDEWIHVTIPGDTGRARRPGIRIHRSITLAVEDTTRHRGIPVTTPTRTVVDLSRALRGRPLLVDTGDAGVDASLAGYLRVITGYNRETVYRIAADPAADPNA